MVYVTSVYISCEFQPTLDLRSERPLRGPQRILDDRSDEVKRRRRKNPATKRRDCAAVVSELTEPRVLFCWRVWVHVFSVEMR